MGKKKSNPLTTAIKKDINKALKTEGEPELKIIEATGDISSGAAREGSRHAAKRDRKKEAEAKAAPGLKKNVKVKLPKKVTVIPDPIPAAGTGITANPKQAADDVGRIQIDQDEPPRPVPNPDELAATMSVVVAGSSNLMEATHPSDDDLEGANRALVDLSDLSGSRRRYSIFRPLNT